MTDTLLEEITAAHGLLTQTVDAASLALGELDLDEQQTFAYDLAHVAARAEVGRAMLEYAAHGPAEAAMAAAFVADSLSDLSGRVFGHEQMWNVDQAILDLARPFCARYTSPEFLGRLLNKLPSAHLDDDFELVRDTFRRLAEQVLVPVAEEIHRNDSDIPDEVISRLATVGAFGLSIPEEYGGFATGGESDYIGMVVATEELSRGSLAAGGSLITRPEILARGLMAGGSEQQRAEWLPKLVTAEKLVAIAVTEPDFGSDVAHVRTTARRLDDGQWSITGMKTWCTFAGRADVLMLLARTDPDAASGHRGLSVFIVEKPRELGHSFRFEQDGGVLEGRAIDTLGYRGMHSFEVSFENWKIPASSLVGGPNGLGRGFYYQMAGFENGRLQTAARAVGVMQAAFEAAQAYAEQRRVFGRTIASYQLTQVKLARMAMYIQAARQGSYSAARAMAAGGGTVEAAMVKAFSCRVAEWVTREAMQIHGGMGYAEEFAVSRLFVDARVLSIFEGADETLCLKVIARRLAHPSK